MRQQVFNNVSCFWSSFSLSIRSTYSHINTISIFTTLLTTCRSAEQLTWQTMSISWYSASSPKSKVLPISHFFKPYPTSLIFAPESRSFKTNCFKFCPQRWVNVKAACHLNDHCLCGTHSSSELGLSGYCISCQGNSALWGYGTKFRMENPCDDWEFNFMDWRVTHLLVRAEQVFTLRDLRGYATRISAAWGLLLHL